MGILMETQYAKILETTVLIIEYRNGQVLSNRIDIHDRKTCSYCLLSR